MRAHSPPVVTRPQPPTMHLRLFRTKSDGRLNSLHVQSTPVAPRNPLHSRPSANARRRRQRAHPCQQSRPRRHPFHDAACAHPCHQSRPRRLPFHDAACAPHARPPPRGCRCGRCDGCRLTAKRAPCASCAAACANAREAARSRPGPWHRRCKGYGHGTLVRQPPAALGWGFVLVIAAGWQLLVAAPDNEANLPSAPFHLGVARRYPTPVAIRAQAVRTFVGRVSARSRAAAIAGTLQRIAGPSDSRQEPQWT